MFDTTYPSAEVAPIPPQPAPLDTRALLPMLRAQSAEVALECLAYAVGGNALSTACWLALNWGVGADLRDPRHPARSAALEPGSPAQKLVDAQAALHTACCRYRATTRDDGLAFARKLIEQQYGSVVADYALAPLDAHSADWEIDTLLFDTERMPQMPTPEQRTAAARARHRLHAVGSRLDRSR